jgi:hypothetical protein
MNNFSKEEDDEKFLLNESNYIKDSVDYFINLNIHTFSDYLVLEDNLRCILKVKKDPTEFYTFDKNHKIRVYIPREVHMTKMTDDDNFHNILSLNDTEVILKDIRLDLKIIRTIYKNYASLILYAKNYDILSNKLGINEPDEFIDSNPIFKNYLDNTDLSAFGVGTNDFLLFSKVDMNYKTDIGKTNNKVATYSIKKRRYINIELD